MKVKNLNHKKTAQTKLERYGDSKYNNIKKTKQTKFNRYNDENYNNHLQSSQTCLEKYGVNNVSKIPNVKEKIKDKLTGRVLSKETKQKISNARLGTQLSKEIALQKAYNTNKTCHEKGLYLKHKTKPEIYLENILVELFGSNNVLYNYFDENKYPYNCDFYIKSKDLFIEVNIGWRHNIKPFNNKDLYCIESLEKWKEKSKTSKNYQNAIYTWTDLDVRKLNTVNANKLNYLMWYPNNIYIINEKPCELLETLVNKIKQDNQQLSIDYIINESSSTIENTSK